MKSKSALLILFIVFLLGLTGYGQATKHFNVKKKVAVGGYDLVSYFQGIPKKGKSTFSSNYQEVTYLFSSSANKDNFEKSPKEYLPAYGGWCAYAMGANGDKVKIDPGTYKIVSGKLYLFYNFYFTNTLDSWNEDEKALMEKAELNWVKIINS